MKRIVSLICIVVAACLLFSSCMNQQAENPETTGGGNDAAETTGETSTTNAAEDSDITLEQVIRAFEIEMGTEIDRNEKPHLDLIGASDGVMFYYANESIVKLFFYETKEDFAKAYDYFEQIRDWPRRGLVILETSDRDALNVFLKIKEDGSYEKTD